MNSSTGRYGLKALAFLAAFLIFSTGSYAQQALSLGEAITYALNASTDARKSKLGIEKGAYQIEEARSRALPHLNGSAGLTYNPILQMSVLPGEIIGQPGTQMLVAFGQKWNANAGISLTQTLFDQAVFTGLKAAKTTQEFYRINAALTDEAIIEKVATAYYQILVQKRQTVVIDSTIKNAQSVLNILNGQFNNGLAKKIDVDRTEVNLSNLQSSRQELLNSVGLLENQLKFLMGMPVETVIVIPEQNLENIHPVAVPEDATASTDNRTEILLLNTQQQLLQYQKESIEAGYYPSLSLSGNYSYQGLSNQFPVFKGRSQGANWFDVASVGVNLRIPLFNGFSTRSKVRQADVEIRELNEDISQTKRALNLAFENAKTQINNSIITLNRQQKNVALAKDVFFNTQNNYNNGLATLTDLLSAENSLTEAQNNYATALLNYKIAEIQLLKSQGSLKSLITK